MRKIIVGIMIAGIFYSAIGNAEKELTLNEPAILSGTFDVGTYNDCCWQGKTIKKRFYFIRLDKSVDIINHLGETKVINGQPKWVESGQIEKNPNIKMIQLDGDTLPTPKFKDGQRITVHCSEVWAGDTGHFALPFFCHEAREVTR
jgi:hypothetical protein